MFVPTRAEVEQVATAVGDRSRQLTSAFYHGGEPIRVIRPFLEEGGPKAVLPGDDGRRTVRAQHSGARYGRHRRYPLRQRHRARQERAHRLHLGANEILQMAGRVHGRVQADGSSSSAIATSSSRPCGPTRPSSSLPGDSERVALTCADARRACRRTRSAGPARPDRLSRGDRLPRASAALSRWPAHAYGRWSKRCPWIDRGPS